MCETSTAIERLYCKKPEENAEDVKSHSPVQRESATPNRLAMNITCFMLSLFFNATDLT